MFSYRKKNREKTKTVKIEIPPITLKILIKRLLCKLSTLAGKTGAFQPTFKPMRKRLNIVFLLWLFFIFFFLFIYICFNCIRYNEWNTVLQFLYHTCTISRGSWRFIKYKNLVNRSRYSLLSRSTLKYD